MAVEHRLTDAEIEAALARGREADRAEPRAVAARYDARTRRVVVDLANGSTLAFPRELVHELRDASTAQVAAIEIQAGGRALRWEALDLDLGVAPMLAGIFGTEAWMRQVRSELGRVGGSTSSPAKASAARENGRKGGRPRKSAA
ncbi:MAG TPA: DUF2442 domain-containing protein [Longimicrobiaceae bacterium]|nr:DUF2442 domain-containing protein [Longimicrobiaceae bacterium]